MCLPERALLSLMGCSENATTRENGSLGILRWLFAKTKYRGLVTKPPREAKDNTGVIVKISRP
jgi:hypothetical protein